MIFVEYTSPVKPESGGVTHIPYRFAGQLPLGGPGPSVPWTVLCTLYYCLNQHRT